VLPITPFRINFCRSQATWLLYQT